MHTLINNKCIRHPQQRRAVPRRQPWPGLLLHGQAARPSPGRPPHAFLRPQDDLAERTKEVWDDEEDIEAAVKRLGPSQAAKPEAGGPLFSQINELYTQQKFPQGHVGPVELRYVAGRGYGLFVTSKVQQGQVLAVCPPLTWVSGPPGQPPSLSDLITHMRRSSFSPAQRRALASLCSLPSLEQQLEQQQREQRQQQQRDRLLAAAETLQREQGFRGAPQGSGSSSLPLSTSARIQAMQRQLKEQRGFLNYQDDADEDEDDEGAEGDQGSNSGRFTNNGSNSLARSGGGGSMQQQQRFPPGRTTPELLQLLEATQDSVQPAAAAGGGGGRLDAAAAAAATVGGGSTRAWGAGWAGRQRGTASISRSESRPAAVGGSSGAALLDMPLDRLTALVCRNALTEPSQDLAASLTRRDRLSSLTGIWPMLAVVNHSCAANAVAVVLGEVPPPPQPQQPQLGASGRPLNALVSAALQRKSARAAAAAAASGPVNPWRSSRQQQQQQDASSGSSKAQQQQLQPARHHLPASVQSWSGGAGAGSSSSGPFVLVRAVHNMEPGDEVMLDYLGSFPEGSFVDPERRRLALAKRWGFTCRCERCIAEQQLGTPIQRSQLAANQLAAGLGPEVMAAVAEAASAGGASIAAAPSRAAPRDADAAGPAAAGSGTVEVLSDAIARLREATLQVEKQLDQPLIPGRVAGWAHASLYQAHALSAMARLALEPHELGSVAAIGTCMELAGMAAPGSAAHLLNAGALVNTSLEQWGETSERVEAAARTMLQVLQLRYGPLEASTAQRLAAATQFWADESAQSRLSLLSPAAAAAVQARKKQQPLAAAPAPAGAHPSQQQQPRKQQQMQQQEEEQGEEELDEVAAALELDAEAVLEVTEELLGDLYGSVDEPQQQQQQQLQSRPAAARDVVARDDLVFVKRRSEAELQAELQMFAGIMEQLSPEQKQELLRRQQQQEQQAAAGTAADGAGDEAGAGAAAAAEATDGDEAEEGEPAAQELPILTSWLQSEAAQEEPEGEELLPQQPQPQQQKQPAPSTGPRQQQPQQPEALVQSPAAAASLKERMAAAAAPAAAAAKPVARSSSSSSSSSTAASGRRPVASGAGAKKRPPSAAAAAAAARAADMAGGAVVDRAASEARPARPDSLSASARVAKAVAGRRLTSLAQTSGPQSLFKKTSGAQEVAPGAAAGSKSGVPRQRPGRPAAPPSPQGGKTAGAAAGPGAAGSGPAPQQQQEKSQKGQQ